MKKLLLLLLFPSVLFIFQKPVRAQSISSLSVSPVIFNVTLSPGKTQTYELRVKNGLEAPIPLHLTVESLDLSQTDETAGAPLRSIASWVHFLETDMILEPGSTRIVPFTVNIPSYLPLGGYYGVIYLHPFFRNSINQDISSKIGVFVLGSIGVQEVPLNKIHLLNPRFTSFLYEGRQTDIRFSVKNSALNHFSAKPFIRITPLFGTVQDVPLEEKIIFPGRTREWAIPITLSAYPGFLYRADLTVSVGGGLQQKTSLYFVAFPVIKLLMVVAVIGLGGIIMKKRKKIRDALRILIRG